MIILDHDDLMRMDYVRAEDGRQRWLCRYFLLKHMRKRHEDLQKPAADSPGPDTGELASQP